MPLLDTIAKMVGVGNKPISAQPEKPAETSRQPAHHELEKLPHIVGEAISVTSNEIRYVLNLKRNDLANLYLRAGGGRGLVTKDHLPVETLANIAEVLVKKTPVKNVLIQRYSGFSLAQVVNFSNSDDVVFIDVPKVLDAQVMQAATKFVSDPTSEDAFRAVLEKIMVHRYYVMTLGLVKLRKLISEHNLLPNTPVEEAVKVFDPAIIVNYPFKNILVAAKNEWDKMQKEVPSEPETGEANSDQETQDGEPSAATAVSGVHFNPRDLENASANMLKLWDAIIKDSKVSGKPIPAEIQKQIRQMNRYIGMQNFEKKHLKNLANG